VLGPPQTAVSGYPDGEKKSKEEVKVLPRINGQVNLLSGAVLRGYHLSSVAARVCSPKTLETLFHVLIYSTELK
jgi:hypothetical protein